MSEREEDARIAARAESERLEALALATRARLAATDQGAQVPQAATPGATADGLVSPASAAPGAWSTAADALA